MKFSLGYNMMIVILWTGLGESGGKINFWWGSILGGWGGGEVPRRKNEQVFDCWGGLPPPFLSSSREISANRQF